MSHPSFSRAALVVSALCLCAPLTIAQTAPKPAKPTAKAAKKKPAPPAPVELVLPEASAEQLDAAERVLYGVSDCEFKQNIDVSIDPKHAGYVELKFNKVNYLMKPVLSSTGAMRLEDVRGQTLLVQISTKSMLLNTQSGQRMVDECVNEKQRQVADSNATTAGTATASTH